MLPFPGSLKPPEAAQGSVFGSVRSMESVGGGGGAEAAGGVQVGAFAPPGCYRAWPPPLRPTDVAGLPCAGSVCAAGRRPGAPATARVSVPRRPLTPRKPDLKTRPGSEPGASPRAVRRLALPQPKNLPFGPPSSQFRLPTCRGPYRPPWSGLAYSSSTAPAGTWGSSRSRWHPWNRLLRFRWKVTWAS